MKITMTATLLLAVAAGAAAAPLTALERQRLMAHLEMTESWLASELSGLSPAQLQFRPAPGAWTILEVLDHLDVAEPIYWQDLQKAMKAPASTRRTAARDTDMLWYGIDRTDRQKAIPSEEPSGRLRDVATGLAAFHRVRAEMLRYVRTTDDDLRAHVVERERSDAYQWLLLVSAHAQRHVLQIREIKANPKFPKT
jgi:hypothetical protein